MDIHPFPYDLVNDPIRFVMHFQVIRNTDEFELRGNMPAIRELFQRITELLKFINDPFGFGK